MHALAQAWLSLQCKMISGASHGLVILGKELADSRASTASWPVGAKHNDNLSIAAREAMTAGKGIVKKGLGNKDIARDIVACPIVVEKRILGVVVIETEGRHETDHQDLLQLLQWSVLWLNFILEEEKTSQKDRLISVIELISTALVHDELHSATTAIATELATNLSCDRVSIGFLHGRKLKVEAISGSVKFDRKTRLASDLSAIMDEAIVQDRLISLPTSDQGNYQITLAHKEFQKRHGDRSLCTVPLSDDGESIGAISFERSAEIPFSRETGELIEHAAQFMGPILELKRWNQRGFFARLKDSTFSIFSAILGREHLMLKMGLIALLVLGAYATLTTADYRVKSQAQIRGVIQQAIVAPVDGYIETADHKAGDIVEKGQLLARLADQDLKLEKTRWLNQRQQLTKEYRTELARHDRAKISIMNAKIKQADAQINLISQQLQHTKIRAPLSGMIVSGDLSQDLGSPVEKGQVLFEVTPLNDYRIFLKVDETEITEIEPGQQGQLVLSALSQENFEFTVTKVTPVAKAEDGKNYFRVEALLDKTNDSGLIQLRPGMQGIGKITIEQRTLIWIWTHKLTDWLRLQWWSWQS